MDRTKPTRRTSVAAVLLAAITIPIALVTLLSLEPVPLLPDMSGLGAGIIQLATVVAAIAVIRLLWCWGCTSWKRAAFSG